MFENTLSVNYVSASMCCYLVADNILGSCWFHYNPSSFDSGCVAEVTNCWRCPWNAHRVQSSCLRNQLVHANAKFEFSSSIFLFCLPFRKLFCFVLEGLGAHTQISPTNKKFHTVHPRSREHVGVSLLRVQWRPTPGVLPSWLQCPVSMKTGSLAQAFIPCQLLLWCGNLLGTVSFVKILICYIND